MLKDLLLTKSQNALQMAVPRKLSSEVSRVYRFPTATAPSGTRTRTTLGSEERACWVTILQPGPAMCM